MIPITHRIRAGTSQPGSTNPLSLNKNRWGAGKIIFPAFLPIYPPITSTRPSTSILIEPPPVSPDHPPQNPSHPLHPGESCSTIRHIM